MSGFKIHNPFSGTANNHQAAAYANAGGASQKSATQPASATHTKVWGSSLNVFGTTPSAGASQQSVAGASEKKVPPSGFLASQNTINAGKSQASLMGGASQPLLQQPGVYQESGQLGSIDQLMQVSVIAWLIFSGICLMIGFAYMDASREIHTILGLGCIFLMLVMYNSWQTRDVSPMSRASFIVSSWLLFAVVMGAWVGLVSYECCIGEYWMYQRLEKRTNVLPSENAGAYANAGGIIFADEARVDSSRSAGYKNENVFCVAPIASDAATATVQFWAGGVNCCAARGNFVCDDSWNDEAHGGIVIRNGSSSPVHKDLYGQFMKAVKLAEVTYSIASAEEPVFVRWVESPTQVELNIWRMGLGVILACIIIAALFCGMQACLIHMIINKKKDDMKYMYEM